MRDTRPRLFNTYFEVRIYAALTPGVLQLPVCGDIDHLREITDPIFSVWSLELFRYTRGGRVGTIHAGMINFNITGVPPVYLWA